VRLAARLPQARTKVERMKANWWLSLCLMVVSTGAAAAGRPVTLEEARRAALEQSLEGAELDLALAQARSVAESAWATLRPSVNVTGQLTYNDHETALSYDIPAIPGFSEASSVDQIVTPQWDYRGTVTLTQTLFNRRAYPALGVAESLAEVAGAERATARYRLVEGVDEAYFAALLLARSSEVALRNLETSRVELERAEKLLSGRVGTEFAVTRAKLSVQSAEQDVASSQLGYRQALESLAALLRSDEAVEVVAPAALPTPPARASLTEQALLSRPELARAAVLATVESHKLEEGEGQLWPTLAAQLQSNLQQTTAFNDEAFRWNAALVFNWDLYAGGATVAEIDRRALSVQRAELAQRRAEEAVTRGLEQAYTRWERAESLVASSRSRAELSKALLEQAKRSEAGGTASRLDVELAQSQAYGAELAVVQAEVEQTASVVALYRMAGLAKPGEPLLK
jgi:outer membrane protein TolC